MELRPAECSDPLPRGPLAFDGAVDLVPQGFQITAVDMDSSSRLTYNASEGKQWSSHTHDQKFIRRNDSEKKDRRVIPLLGSRYAQDEWPIGSNASAGLQRLQIRRKNEPGILLRCKKNSSKSPRESSR